MDPLRVANWVAGGIQIVQGGVLTGLIATSDKPDSWPLQLFNQAGEVVWETEYRLGPLVAAFPYLSCVSHFTSAAVGFDSKENAVRWIEYGVTAGMMTWIVAALSGVTSVSTLVTLMLLNFVLQGIGYMIEVGIREGKSVVGLMAAGFAIHTAIWTTIISSFVVATTYSETKPPDAVYAIVWVLFGLFTSFGALQTAYAAGTIDYRAYEWGFVGLSLSSKSFLVWMTYGGVLNARS